MKTLWKERNDNKLNCSTDEVIKEIAAAVRISPCFRANHVGVKHPRVPLGGVKLAKAPSPGRTRRAKYPMTSSPRLHLVDYLLALLV